MNDKKLNKNPNDESLIERKIALTQLNEKIENNVAHITLNRPEKRNAFSDELVEELKTNFSKVTDMNKMNELLDLVNVSFFIFVLQVEFGLPEVDTQLLVSKAKGVGGIEHLDTLLGFLHLFVANVTNFV